MHSSFVLLSEIIKLKFNLNEINLNSNQNAVFDH